MKKVVIYTTPSCSYCYMAKEFFKEHDIKFKEKNVAKDVATQKKMIEISGQMGVPVIEIGDDIVIGFNLSVIKKLLNL